MPQWMGSGHSAARVCSVNLTHRLFPKADSGLNTIAHNFMPPPPHHEVNSASLLFVFSCFCKVLITSKIQSGGSEQLKAHKPSSLLLQSATGPTFGIIKAAPVRDTTDLLCDHLTCHVTVPSRAALCRAWESAEG